MHAPRFPTVLPLLVACLLSGATATPAAPGTQDQDQPRERQAAATRESDAWLDASWQAIGWRLFSETRLSRTGTYSCASCHVPAHAFSDGRRLAVGLYGDTLRRHTPRLNDLHDADAFYWDGRSPSLEAQALEPLLHPQEMDLTPAEIGLRVRADEAYRTAFRAVDVELIETEHVTRALAAFVRSLESGENAFDRWLQEDPQALSEAQDRGRVLFFTRGRCGTCHFRGTGPEDVNLSDHRFHNIGTGTQTDRGRFEVTGDTADLGKFKTPTLRGWLGSAPFMHDGRFATLDEVLDHYDQGGTGGLGTSELVPLHLDAQGRADLVAFLHALSGEPPDLDRHARQWRELTAGFQFFGGASSEAPPSGAPASAASTSDDASSSPSSAASQRSMR